MNPNLDPESRRIRAKAAVLQATVLVAVIAGLLALGATAPDRKRMAINCAIDTSGSVTASDAMLELTSACPGATQAATGPATAPATNAHARYGVPAASSVLDPRAEPEPQPPTF